MDRVRLGRLGRFIDWWWGLSGLVYTMTALVLLTEISQILVLFVDDLGYGRMIVLYITIS